MYAFLKSSILSFLVSKSSTIYFENQQNNQNISFWMN